MSHVLVRISPIKKQQQTTIHRHTDTNRGYLTLFDEQEAPQRIVENGSGLRILRHIHKGEVLTLHTSHTAIKTISPIGSRVEDA